MNFLHRFLGILSAYAYYHKSSINPLLSNKLPPSLIRPLFSFSLFSFKLPSPPPHDYLLINDRLF